MKSGTVNGDGMFTGSSQMSLYREEIVSRVGKFPSVNLRGATEVPRLARGAVAQLSSA